MESLSDNPIINFPYLEKMTFRRASQMSSRRISGI